MQDQFHRLSIISHLPEWIAVVIFAIWRTGGGGALVLLCDRSGGNFVFTVFDGLSLGRHVQCLRACLRVVVMVDN